MRKRRLLLGGIVNHACLDRTIENYGQSKLNHRPKVHSEYFTRRNTTKYMIKYCPTNNLKYHNRIAMALINVNTNSASPLTLTLNKMENNNWPNLILDAFCDLFETICQSRC